MKTPTSAAIPCGNLRKSQLYFYVQQWSTAVYVRMITWHLSIICQFKLDHIGVILGPLAVARVLWSWVYKWLCMSVLQSFRFFVRLSENFVGINPLLFFFWNSAWCQGSMWGWVWQSQMFIEKSALSKNGQIWPENGCRELCCRTVLVKEKRVADVTTSCKNYVSGKILV